MRRNRELKDYYKAAGGPAAGLSIITQADDAGGAGADGLCGGPVSAAARPAVSGPGLRGTSGRWPAVQASAPVPPAPPARPPAAGTGTDTVTDSVTVTVTSRLVTSKSAATT